MSSLSAPLSDAVGCKASWDQKPYVLGNAQPGPCGDSTVFRRRARMPAGPIYPTLSWLALSVTFQRHCVDDGIPRRGFRRERSARGESDAGSYWSCPPTCQLNHCGALMLSRARLQVPAARSRLAVRSTCPQILPRGTMTSNRYASSVLPFGPLFPFSVALCAIQCDAALSLRFTETPEPRPWQTARDGGQLYLAHW